MNDVLLSQVRKPSQKKEIEMRIRHILTIAVLLVLSTVLTASASYTNHAPVPRTGQTKCYDAGGAEIPCIGTGQDGEYQMGIVWPNPRFTNNSDGTVTDNLTGLIWLQDANCTDTVGGIVKSSETLTWTAALTWTNSLANGDCGLLDGSNPGDWRLPNVREMQSLVYYGVHEPAVPNTTGTGQWTTDGDPFIGVPSSVVYWSSSTYSGVTAWSWVVHLGSGWVRTDSRDMEYYVWPVRDESAPCPSCATGGATEPFKPMALFGPWLLLATAVASGAIAALALKRCAA